MKNSVSPAVAIGLIAVVVVVVGFLAVKFLFPNPNASPDSEAAKKQYEETHANSVITQHMQRGNAAGVPTGQPAQNNRGAYGSAPQTGGR